MYYFIDADYEKPIKDNNPWVIAYFLLFIICGSMFLLNLFICVVFLNYHIAEKNARNKYLTENQAKWIEL